MAGILKDILLVFASIMFFHDPVTLQQFFGYSIALGGLLYYKLGAEKVRSLATDARLSATEYRRANPVKALIIAVGSVVALLVLILNSSPGSTAAFVKNRAGILPNRTGGKA